jgi:hypothetical protein
MTENKMATQQTDWQVSHTENQGKTTVVFNLADDPDDAAGLVIAVRGRGHAKFAEMLAALLQERGFSSLPG